jgi:hypothetical protein
MTLPLDTFRRILAFHPWHFFGLADQVYVPVTSDCNDVLVEDAWQSAALAGRQQIREAIQTAESRLAEYLGYRIGVGAGTEDVQVHGIVYTGSVGYPWLTSPQIGLSEGYVQSLGAETLTLVGTTAVVMSDRDGDGLDETFTVTIATTETDPAKLRVYLTASDSYDGDMTQIEPIRISISGGVATIRGALWLIVKPALYQGVRSQSLDPTDPATFVSTLDVYQVGVDATAALTFTQSQACSCGDTPASPVTGTGTIVDSANGIIALDTCSLPCGHYDRVTVRHLAGVPLNSSWETIVARLAAAELAAPLCACEDASAELYRWQKDLALTGKGDEIFGAISQDDLSNPLGTRRGAVYAYRQIRNLRQLRGFAAG